MSEFYSDKHRALQDKFDSRRMADFMEENMFHKEFAPEDTGFIESRDMFFLSSIDESSRPTVSYKGGAPGFVKVTGPSSLAFPSYDGNGMYYSMGNIMVAPKVGLLFMDFETPHRLRVQGSAEIKFDGPLMASSPGAQFIVTVEVEEIWINCSRYIHSYKKIANSKFVPEADGSAPVPAWKRIDVVQEALPAKDQDKADENGGLITIDEFGEMIGKGEV